ncbi:hypothetical protein [Planococcus sp. S3-L1]|uniref:hypothetical protein n=1 Tax=Planococcus sp. S3-L1 TaxID=3046200 RepID=UPI0024BBA455|nr:hypothetical protein [Planococcus sp. S3-L1]MDJ0332985.1 hypothetical protein [Planococcus sp. S3-L1]
MKNLIIMAFLFLSFGIWNTNVLAVDNVPKSLDKSIVNIVSDGSGNYKINQQIFLTGSGNFSGNQIEHTFSKLKNIEPTNLQFLYQENELDFTTEESSTLVRYYVQIPEGVSDAFEYEVEYAISVDENIFITPLFVPTHPAAGQENAVTINFETTAGNIVQRNSFPVLKKAEDNSVTSYLMNIPSHVNYVYGSERNIFNLFNIVSWSSIIILLSIVAIWIRSEVKSNNLEGVNK